MARGRVLFPSDKEGAARRLAMEALDAVPEGSKPLLISDLNADLDFDAGLPPPADAAVTGTLVLAAATDTTVGGPD